jgi:hypothetical protein
VPDLATEKDMEDITMTLPAEQPFLAQCSFNWDSIEPYSVQDTEPSNLAPAVSSEQLPSANWTIRSADESPTPVGSAVDRVDGAPDGSTASDIAAEPSEHDAGRDAKPDPIPPGGSIPVRTGREAMQSRAVRLYGTIFKLAGLTPMDPRTVGDPIMVDNEFVARLQSAYMAANKRYQDALADIPASQPSKIRPERRRAWDHARKEIGRAFDDLVEIYAADEVVGEGTGKRLGCWVYRLPEVLRRQLAHGADSVLPRPGGRRIIVDRAGFEVGRQRPVHSRTVQSAESQAMEESNRSLSD